MKQTNKENIEYLEYKIEKLNQQVEKSQQKKNMDKEMISKLQQESVKLCEGFQQRE